ncbi:MAG TPA: aspartyl protease family protein [Candidatus Binatia bacterium]|nr:aspartyl protease family protein [Candidatus Binatia bacterium]
MRRVLPVALSLSALLAACPPAARAEIYRYVDEKGQASYVDGIENVPERFRRVATPIGMRNAPAATAPAGSGAGGPSKPTGAAVIKYTPGQRIVVDVKINGTFTAKLLLDTGADRTMISPRTLQAAGVTINRPVASGQITGATGTDKIDYVVVDSLEVGEARVGKMPVASYELAGDGGEGLLGRDFLDQFKVTIDAAAGEVHLAPK